MQQLNPSEISEIIKSRIDQLDVSSEARNEGTVVSVTIMTDENGSPKKERGSDTAEDRRLDAAPAAPSAPLSLPQRSPRPILWLRISGS